MYIFVVVFIFIFLFLALSPAFSKMAALTTKTFARRVAFKILSLKLLSASLFPALRRLHYIQSICIYTYICIYIIVQLYLLLMRNCMRAKTLTTSFFLASLYFLIRVLLHLSLKLYFHCLSVCVLNAGLKLSCLVFQFEILMLFTKLPLQLRKCFQIV